MECGSYGGIKLLEHAMKVPMNLKHWYETRKVTHWTLAYLDSATKYIRRKRHCTLSASCIVLALMLELICESLNEPDDSK